MPHKKASFYYLFIISWYQEMNYWYQEIFWELPTGRKTHVFRERLFKEIPRKVEEYLISRYEILDSIFFISRIRFFDIKRWQYYLISRIRFSDIKENIILDIKKMKFISWYKEIEFLILRTGILDILNSISSYQEIFTISWYQEIEFLISRNDFLISRIPFLDIRKQIFDF